MCASTTAAVPRPNSRPRSPTPSPARNPTAVAPAGPPRPAGGSGARAWVGAGRLSARRIGPTRAHAAARTPQTGGDPMAASRNVTARRVSRPCRPSRGAGSGSSSPRCRHPARSRASQKLGAATTRRAIARPSAVRAVRVAGRRSALRWAESSVRRKAPLRTAARMVGPSAGASSTVAAPSGARPLTASTVARSPSSTLVTATSGSRVRSLGLVGVTPSDGTTADASSLPAASRATRSSPCAWTVDRCSAGTSYT